MEKKKRDFQGPNRVRRGLLFVGLFVSAFILICFGMKFLPQSVPTGPIALDLTCLETLTEQNIDQMQMLEAYAWTDFGRHIQFSSDGSLLAFSTDFGVNVIDFVSKRQMSFRQTDARPAWEDERGENGSGYLFSADSRFVITYAWTKRKEGGLRVWDVKSTSLAYEISIENTYAAAISPDNRFVVFTIESGTYWVDLNQNAWQRHPLTLDKAFMLAFNPMQGEDLFAGTEHNLMVFQLPQAKTNDSVAQMVSIDKTLAFNRGSRFEFSQDKTHLFIFTSWTYGTTIIKTWNLNTEKEENRTSVQGVAFDLAFNREKNLWAYTSEVVYHPHNGWEITVFDVKTNSAVFQHREQAIYDLSFHPTEPLLVFAGGENKDIQVWNYITGKNVRTFPLRENTSYQLQFNSQGTLLAFIDQRSLQVWGHKSC